MSPEASVEYEPELGAATPDSIRLWLALGLLLLMTLDIIALLISIITAKVSVKDLATVTTALLSPVVGLVGTAIGFYFGKTDESTT